MRESGSGASVTIAPFCGVFHDGIDRLIDIWKPEGFSIIVNGTELKSNVAEAVLLSPTIYEHLRHRPKERSFCFETDRVDPKTVRAFLGFGWGKSTWILSKDNELKFLLCCALLGNERLGMIVLNSMHADEDVPGKGIVKGKDVSSETTLMGKLASFGALSHSCASRFWSYSVAELRCMTKRTLHSLLSSSSLVLQSEDALLQLLIDIDSETYEFWHYIEISLLSVEALSRYAQALPFDRLTSDIWAKIVSHLRGVNVDELRQRRFHQTDTCPGQSTILTTVPAPLKQFEAKKWKLLYRGSRDGFRSSDFHRLCNGQTNTVTVILTTNGNIFGGFTPVAWDSSGGYRQDSSQKSFLFTVKDARGSSPTTFPIASYQYAIQGNPSYGPMFGGGSDLCVSDNCQTNPSTCQGSGHTYRNTQVGGFTGEPDFKVKEIEVLSITS
jgi:hypothetical protein